MSCPLKFYPRTGFAMLLLFVMNPATQADDPDDKVRAEVKTTCDEIIAVKLDREKYQSETDPKANETWAWVFCIKEMHESFNNCSFAKSQLALQ